MPNYSPLSSSYETVPTSPSETPYNTENRIRFVTRGLRSTITDEIIILDPRNLQQWQLDTALARAEGISNQFEARLYKVARELDHEITQLHHDMNDFLRLRKEDLKRAQRRHNEALLFCVFVGLVGVLGCWVLRHRGKELFDFE